MKPPLWLLLHASAHASMASKEQLFLMVTEPRSGSDWLVDLCVTALVESTGRRCKKGATRTAVLKNALIK